MIKLGELIRKKRRLAGITQEELAERVGVTDGYIGKIEIGFQEPAYKTLMKIAKALNIETSELPTVMDDRELIAEISMLQDKLGELDRQLISLHPRVKMFLLAIAPTVEIYL